MQIVMSAMKRIGFSECSERTRVESVERALLILKCFDEEEEALSLATLAQRTELYKSTILRLSASLRYMGFLRRRSNGCFVLGPETQRLGILALRQPRTDLETLIRPALRRLVKATHETASFFIRDGDQRICLCRENSPRPIRHHLEEGTRHPLHRGAAGQILRAYATPSHGSGAKPAHKGDWIVSRGKRDPDLAGVAVPVFNNRQQFVGALSVSGLLSRFSPAACEKAKRALLKEARHLPDQITE